MADSRVTSLTEVSVVALDDVFYVVDSSDTTDDAAGSSRRIPGNRLFGFMNQVCQGRLTLESGVPVSTSDQTAKTNLYFTPCDGNKIALYDGTRWKLYSFSELTLALGTLTSGKNYDVFVYDNAGTLTQELSAAWTNDTTRADALTLQDGVYVKSVATTRRYVGTFRTTSTTTTELSFGGVTTQVGAKIFLWNMYNQVDVRCQVHTETANYTYSTSDYRQTEAAAGNSVQVVCGMPGESLMHLTAISQARASGAALNMSTAIGYDSTTVPDPACIFNNGVTYDATATVICACQLCKPVGLGYHSFNWLEVGAGSGTQTWVGQNTTAGDIVRRPGMVGSYKC